MSKNLVIVESPAKGKTIEKFLGKDYTVVASFGHIRDLPKKNIGVDIDAGFVPDYEISPEKKKRVAELKKMVKSSQKVWIATDEDREGEAIWWHLCQALGLSVEDTDRIVFHEITKSAIEKAIKNPRKIFQHLVDAQQSRRILDRIVGYEVSPVLWKKVKPGLSAGRVQSVAVKLLVEREREIRAFEPKESWKISAQLDNKIPFSVDLYAVGGKKFSPKTEKSAKELLQKYSDEEIISGKDKKNHIFLEGKTATEFLLKKTEKKSSKRLPWAPFTTSTLQQEAARKLGFSVKGTMDVAQKLYQNGHITYMRTDSVNLSNEAMNACQSFIQKEFGMGYALPNGRKFTTKQASAQEAHEAIRPTHMENTPESILLSDGEKKLYKLIWERTVASQMKEATVELTTYFFETKMGDDWIAKGEVIKFPGFMKLYVEGTDDEEGEKFEAKKLPEIRENEVLFAKKITASQKFSLPPARYTEASLVKKLEQEGIGRPSTYAPTIQTIQDRGYVTLESKKLLPTDVAFVVTDFLESEFSEFMKYSFTAEIENKFDKIAAGDLAWQKMLSDFYNPFHQLVEEAAGMEGKFSGERILWEDPESKKTVLVRMSRFGPVAQIGTPDEILEWEKPRYASLSAGLSIDDITLEEALKLFVFPKNFELYEGAEVSVVLGRFGPYIKWGEKYVSIPKTLDPLAIDYATIVSLIEQKKQEDSPIGFYKEVPYTRGKGRFWPFLKYQNVYVSIPKNIDPENITQEEAEKLIVAKLEKEANRYIHQWPEEKISVENGRYGPFIRFGKKNFYLKKWGEKITDAEQIQKLTLDDVKNIILEQDPSAIKWPKKTQKKSPKTKK